MIKASAILLFIFLGSSLYADDCNNQLAALSDIATIKSNDRKLLDSFYKTNQKKLAELNQEALDLTHLLGQSMTNEIADLAKQVRTGVGDQTNHLRLLNAKLLKIIPKVLNENSFYNQVSDNNEFRQIYNWPESDLDDVAQGELANGLYETGVRKVKKGWIHDEPLVTLENQTLGLVINSTFRNINGEGVLERKPWEIEIFYYLKTNQIPTLLPVTKVNEGKPIEDSAYIEYFTPRLFLNLTSGSIRVETTPGDDAQLLNSANPEIGTARVVSRYMHQRWQLEEDLEHLP